MARCSQKCMVVNYGKLIPEENFKSEIKKKIFRKTHGHNYIKCYQKNLQMVNESQKIDVS